jgi:hypothetical protein
MRARANTGTEFLPATEVIGALARLRCASGRRTSRHMPGAISIPYAILFTTEDTQNTEKGSGEQSQRAKSAHLSGFQFLFFLSLFSVNSAFSVVPVIKIPIPNKTKELRP